MPRRRLLGQLFPSFLLPVSLALAAVLWFAIHGFEVLSLGTLRDHLTAEARSLSDRFRSPTAKPRGRGSGPRATGSAATARFVVLSPAGQVLFDTSRRRGDGDGWLDRLEVSRALQGQGDSAVRYQPTTTAKDALGGRADQARRTSDRRGGGSRIVGRARPGDFAVRNLADLGGDRRGRPGVTVDFCRLAPLGSAAWRRCGRRPNVLPAASSVSA